MKRLLFVAFLSLTFCTVSVANTFHQSMSGVVDAVTKDTITVAAKVYKYTPQTTFRAHEKKGDAIYEVSAQKDDIRPGQYVVVYAEASTALQVVIARWRE